MTPAQEWSLGGEPGRRGDRIQRLARGLGWLSLGLGAVQLAMPRAFDRSIGAPARLVVTRLVGAREVTAGAGILRRDQPAGWLLLRVLGDAVDLYLLGRSLRSRRADRKRLAAAASSVVLLGIVDALGATLAGMGPTAAEHPKRRHPRQVTSSVTVGPPQEEVYRFWRDVRNLPRFVEELTSVEVLDDRRSRWAAGDLRWEVEIVDDRPGELIAWRASGPALAVGTGVVRFERAPGGRGTEVHLALSPSSSASFVRRGVAAILGRTLDTPAAAALRRFKQVIETGEIVRSDASVHRGPHPAQPPAGPWAAPRSTAGAGGVRSTTSQMQGGAR